MSCARDRDLESPLFPELSDARPRMAMTRACRATGTPHFSPHGLRRRHGSLHYKRTGSLADAAELLGDSKRVAADGPCARAPADLEFAGGVPRLLYLV